MLTERVQASSLVGQGDIQTDSSKVEFGRILPVLGRGHVQIPALRDYVGLLVLQNHLQGILCLESSAFVDRMKPSTDTLLHTYYIGRHHRIAAVGIPCHNHTYMGLGTFGMDSAWDNGDDDAGGVGVGDDAGAVGVDGAVHVGVVDAVVDADADAAWVALWEPPKILLFEACKGILLMVEDNRRCQNGQVPDWRCTVDIHELEKAPPKGMGERMEVARRREEGGRQGELLRLLGRHALTAVVLLYALLARQALHRPPVPILRQQLVQKNKSQRI